ncbi:MAG: SdpI family protein [Asticcacaulis sp.]
MTMKSTKIGSLAAIALTAGFSLWARLHLADAPIATHFDLQGHVNGYMPRDMALAFLPALALILSLFLLWILPAIMPKNASLSRSSEAYGIFGLATVLFLCGIHVVLIAGALGLPLDRVRISLGGAGLLFLVIGNYLPKMRFNYVAGFKTPWTLSNEEVWDKTHRLGGRLFMLTGLLTVIAAIFLPASFGFAVLLLMALLTTLITTGYSYVVARRRNLA